jgi:hypothetical protein
MMHRLRRSLLLAYALMALPGHAQTLGGGQAMNIPIGRILAALLICLLIAFVMVLVLRRRFGGRPMLQGLEQSFSRRGNAAPAIRIIETRRLSPAADVCRFTSGNREYLVILTAGGATVLNDAATTEPREPPLSAGGKPA